MVCGAATVHFFQAEDGIRDLTVTGVQTCALPICHSNGCPLMLSELLAADDTNFAHDVFGIRAKLNRETGALSDGFVPRFAKIAAEELITALRAREQEENE